MGARRTLFRMIAMTLAEIAAVVGGRVDGPPGLVVTGAAYVDTRVPQPAGLFVALTGDRSDGHDHAGGAHVALASRPCGAPSVLVRDPVVALAALARHVVRAVAPTVLAVTGSHGKTGTKDLLAQLLPGATATLGNQNNELGVPLTVLRATASSEQLVLEMGARGLGQLSWLTDIAPPQVAAVVAVGSAHLGAFGSRELTARAKGELVEALPAAGVAVLNADDPAVLAMAGRTRARVLTFGRAGAVTWRGVVLDELARPSFLLGHAGSWVPVALRTSGAHQVQAAAAAAAMALATGETLAAVGPRLSSAVPLSPHRMSPLVRDDGLLVIDDAYNANPESMTAALRALAAMGARRPGRTIAVLGAMGELGAASGALHRDVADLADRLGIDEVLAVGTTAYGVPAVRDREQALRWLRGRVGSEDTVLVKASRRAQLDLLAAALVGLPSTGRVHSQPAQLAEGAARVRTSRPCTS